MSSEQLNTENVVEEVKTVVEETVAETVEETTVPAVETVEETVAETATEDRKSKNKSFFSIFKKDTEEAAVDADAAPAATEEATTEDAAEGEAATDAAAAEEVPVETSPAKKGRLCGLCAFGKKSEEAAPAATEEAPAAEATEATDAAPVEEAAAAEAEPVAEEAAAAEAPVEEAAAVAAAGESTEGEAVAPVTEADIVRSGVLFKSGKFIKGHLNERHCRLLANGVFQWSKTEDFSKAHECKISAETSTVAFMAEGEDAPHKYRMEVHCCGSVVTYAVDTEEDRDEWIRAIETVKESVTPAAEATEEVAEAAEEVAAE